MKMQDIYNNCGGNARKIMLSLRSEDNMNILIKETSTLPDYITKSERYYCWLNKLTEIPACPYCGKPKKFHDLQHGYFSSCGDVECKSKAKSDSNRNRVVDWVAVHKKMEETYAKNHNGIRHNMQDPEAKAKFFENYKKNHNGESCGVVSKKAVEARQKAFDEKYDGNVRNALVSGIEAKYGSLSECARQNAEKSRDKIRESKDASIIKKIKECDNYEVVSINSEIIILKCPNCGTVFELKRNEFNKKYRAGDYNLCDICGFSRLVEQYNCGDVSSRELITRVKMSDLYIKKLCEETEFLDVYNPSVTERLYYVVNDIDDIVRCEYCGKKAKWNSRDVLDEGYTLTCGDKECGSKRISDLHSGVTIISENRLQNFIEWEKSVIEINDDIVKKNIKYCYLLEHITNPIILDYLKKRFDDSDSLEETLQRIQIGVEKKPICANLDCNNPVKWIGRKRALYTTYCSCKCSANCEDTVVKRKITNVENWGTEGIYDSSLYQKEYFEKTGYMWIANNPDIKEKIYLSKKENNSWAGSTSKQEQKLFSILTEELGYNIETHYKSELYPFNCDVYIPSLDLFIEYQGWQGHGNHPYTDSVADRAIVNRWRVNEEIVLRTNASSQYTSMIKTWTVLDPMKRKVAKENKIKLLEIFKFKDAADVQKQINNYLNNFSQN